MAIPVEVMKFVYLLCFCIVIGVVINLWRRLRIVEEKDGNLSYRGQLLHNQLLFLNVYALSWLLVLFLGFLDGELETASVSTGLKGILAYSHCALHDLIVRTYCVSIIVSVALYAKFYDVEEADSCCYGRPSIFTWGTFAPLVVIEANRFLLNQKEWLMPTKGILKQLSEMQGYNVEFTLESTPVFCVQRMDSEWLQQAVAEWFSSVVLVVILVFGCLPCFLHQEDSESKDDDDDDVESVDISPEDQIKLQMDSLLVSGSESSEERPSTPQPSSLSELRGYFSKGPYILESFVAVGLFWASAIRPFFAVCLYMTHTEIYCNYFDIPTHVLLMLGAIILPFELFSPCNEEMALEEGGVTKIPKSSLWPDFEDRTSDDVIASPERNVEPSAPVMSEDDVDPIWAEEDVSQRVIQCSCGNEITVDESLKTEEYDSNGKIETEGLKTEEDIPKDKIATESLEREKDDPKEKIAAKRLKTEEDSPN